MPGRLQGRRAVITGAASGIGRATALRLAAEGAQVVAADVAREVEDTAAQIRADGGRAVAIVGDVADAAVVDALVARSLAEHGGLEIAVANAGVAGRLATLDQLEVADWDAVLRVNVIATFLLVQRAARHMQEHGGGSIVCTASVAGLRSGAGPVPYSASKAAVVNLVQTAAMQLAGSGVRVNAVCPGLVETGMTRPLFEAARRKGNEGKIGQVNPLGRAGTVDELAAAITFLASDDAAYVNGTALVVDGGLAASHPYVRGSMF